MSHFLIATQREWLGEHGVRQKGGGWVCKETGAPINQKIFRYQLYGLSDGGPQFEKRVHPQDEGGRTYEVIVLWCTHCDMEPQERPPLAIPEGIVEVVGT